jgi:DNA-binding transcriptional LysR family regulator
LELRTLRYFLAIVDHGSVTAAAHHVHIAQPAISRQVQALEVELGVKLFLRDGRRLRLSPAGRRLLPIVRDLIARADSARATMTALAQGVHVHLTVAAHPTTISDVIAPFVASRGASFTTPTFVVASADAAYDALARAEVDLAISTNPPPRDTASQLVARFPIWAQIPSTHRWAGHDRIALPTLLRQRLIVLDLTHGTRRVFEDEVRRSHDSYRMAAEVGVSGIAQAMAASGIGVAILTDDPAYDLHKLYIDGADGPLHISLYAVWDPTHYSAASIREFATALAEHAVKGAERLAAGVPAPTVRSDPGMRES